MHGMGTVRCRGKVELNITVRWDWSSSNPILFTFVCKLVHNVLARFEDTQSNTVFLPTEFPMPGLGFPSELALILLPLLLTEYASDRP
jgi:hypothetical protein